jgi:hypothetical protein
MNALQLPTVIIIPVPFYCSPSEIEVRRVLPAAKFGFQGIKSLKSFVAISFCQQIGKC